MRTFTYIGHGVSINVLLLAFRLKICFEMSSEEATGASMTKFPFCAPKMNPFLTDDSLHAFLIVASASVAV
jgi:hypothetical protein